MSAGQLPPGHTLDAFHRGRFVLVQPRRGHRAGMDALVLAAALPDGFDGRLADLGAGAGAAALAALSRCPAASAVLVEREAEMLAAARATLVRPENADLARRAEVLEADVAAAGKARAGSGLADRSFDAAILNPPFNDPADRSSPDPLRRSAHVMADAPFEAWIRTGAAILKPGGQMALIARPASLDAILAALRGRFGAARVVPVLPRDDEPAIRVVVAARKGSRAALALLPPLVLHEGEANRPTPRADAVINGRAALFEN